MGDDLAVFARLVAARVRSDAHHRLSFVLYLIGQVAAAGLDLLVILVLFANVDALAGWSRPEVVLLYGLGGTAFGLADLLVSPVELVARHLQEGTFDQFLLRPVSPLLQLCAHEFALRRAGRLVQPAAALVLALGRVDVSWDAAHVVAVPVTVAAGTAIFGSLWVLAASASFWTIGSLEAANAITYGGNHLSQYPVDVFGPSLRRLVVFVVPVAFVAYLPAVWLLGRPAGLGLPAPTGLASPLVAGVLVLLARAVWGAAVRRHRSTGS